MSEYDILRDRYIEVQRRLEAEGKRQPTPEEVTTINNFLNWQRRFKPIGHTKPKIPPGIRDDRLPPRPWMPVQPRPLPPETKPIRLPGQPLPKPPYKKPIGKPAHPGPKPDRMPELGDKVSIDFKEAQRQLLERKQIMARAQPAVAKAKR